MLKRLVAAILCMLVLAGCGTGPKEYAWQEIDTTVDVQQDGTLRVTEELTLRYIQGTFSFVERDLPYRNLDSIEDITVRTDGREMSETDSGEPYTFTVERVNGVERVHAIHPKSSNGTRTITVSYTVAGALRRDYSPTQPMDGDQHQQIWWAMVFPQRDSAVERATGRITLPAEFAASQIEADTPDARGSVEIGTSDVSVLATDVDAGEELSLRVTFPRTIANDSDMAFFSPYSSLNRAANAAPVADSEDEANPDFIYMIIIGLVVVGSIVWNIYRWANGEDVNSNNSGGHYRSYRSSGSSHRRSSGSSRRSSSSSRRSSGGGGGRAG